MKQSIVKFLEFRGKNLLFLSKNGNHFIAIKPVCEALNLNYDRQYKNIIEDPILSQLYAVQPMVAADKKIRKMVCLPEQFIYGWIFSIKSNSPQLQEYKKECYEILFNHFHGTITSRRELLSQKALAEMERSQLEAQLRMSHSFSKWESLKATEARIGKQLKEADRNEINEQMQLFD
jgi:hypothetical protein